MAAHTYNPSRQFINIERVGTDQLGLHNHISWFLLEKPRLQNLRTGRMSRMLEKEWDRRWRPTPPTLAISVRQSVCSDSIASLTTLADSL
jgi:hypothetical protein